MIAALGLGCGDRGGSTASASASESASGSSSEPGGATVPTEGSGSMSASDSEDAGGVSESLSGTTDISGGMSASMSGGGSGAGSETDSGTGGSESTGMISGGGETSASTGTTGEPLDCAELDNEAACVAAGCMAIVARPFFNDFATWCLESPVFLACQPEVGCDDAITTACEGPTMYQFKNGCLAPGFAICPAPPDPNMNGYKDCA